MRGPDLRELCKRCNRRSPLGFHVSDEIWSNITHGRYNVLCIMCFDELASFEGIAWEEGIKFFPVSWATATSLSK